MSDTPWFDALLADWDAGEVHAGTLDASELLIPTDHFPRPGPSGFTGWLTGEISRREADKAAYDSLEGTATWSAPTEFELEQVGSIWKEENATVLPDDPAREAKVAQAVAARLREMAAGGK